MSQQDHIDSSPLGQGTDYVCHYDPKQLYPIPRANKWQQDYDACPYEGVDIWNAYEISWLNPKGLPQVAIGEFRVPAESPNIIESKSFKLYLNSFNLTRFANQQEVEALMAKDLSEAAGANVSVMLKPVSSTTNVGEFSGACFEGKGSEGKGFEGVCIDDLDIEVSHYHPTPGILTASATEQVTETLVSHLLKSNCPVTGQPDWASLQVQYQGPKISREGLLAYIISYREHGDFHEQCVEQIFTDLLQRCRPVQLVVYARYVRRGGLDINPYRATSGMPEAANTRLSRQ